MIKRNQITGFTIKLFSYYIEVVFVKYIPRVLEISDLRYMTIKRWEI